ncbi:MAG: two pore domain potassium channel family protein [Chromatiaceae bacterium]|nr:two pore domain potassium channel family protein [Chromatiaceae bacterium]MBP6809393.1 two pore domain potassium channel family protein [Chromatiaceae bacterium]
MAYKIPERVFPLFLEAPAATGSGLMKPQHLARNNVILLVSLLILILFYPLFQADRLLVRDLLLSAVFFSGIFSLEFSAQSRMLLLSLATLTTGTTWIHHFNDNDLLSLIDFATSSVTLAVIVVLMIRHIARSRIVTPTIILSSVNVYLLLGVLGAVLLSIADAVHVFLNGGESAGIALPSQGPPEFSDYLYLAIITLTTVGFGDVTAVSRLTRSVVMLIGLAGPLYMTILVAMLVGKFLADHEGK